MPVHTNQDSIEFQGIKIFDSRKNFWKINIPTVWIQLCTNLAPKCVRNYFAGNCLCYSVSLQSPNCWSFLYTAMPLIYSNAVAVHQVE